VPRSELLRTALPDVQSWWSEYGRPGWVANRWLFEEAPWVLAGHVRGTFRLDEPGRAPRRLIDPAGLGSFTPLSWYDSVRVQPGAGAATQGFGGAFVTVEGMSGHDVAPTRATSGAEGVADLRSGDGAWDENSLMVSRRDTVSWLRIEAHGLTRGPAGTLDLAGRHVWQVDGGMRRGAHELAVAYAAQGVGATLLGTEQEDTWAQVGSATYRWHARSGGAELAFSRGRSRTISYSEFFPLSRRASAASELSARAWRSGFTGGIRYDREETARDFADIFHARARSYWADGGWTGELGGGRLVVAVGAGKHDAFSTPEVAPSVSYEVGAGAIRARVGAERVLNAVWSDLALVPGTHRTYAPFLQRTLLGVADVTIGTHYERQLRTWVLAGRTNSRAIASRTPLSEATLRRLEGLPVLQRGIAEDPDPYTFALVSAEGRMISESVPLLRSLPWLGRAFRPHRTSAWFGEAYGFGLVKPAQTVSPNVDPVIGGRAIVGGRWRLFQGDLGIEAYGGGDFVGSRWSEFREYQLPGYGVSSLGLLFTLADATITIRARNLENRFRLEPWLDTSLNIDPNGPFAGEAVGPGREIRFALTLTLRN